MIIHEEFNFANRIIRRTAARMIGTAGLVEADVPDLQQDLWLELLTRLPKYRADRGNPRAFITLVVRNRRASIIAERLAKKRGNDKPCLSLDAEKEDAKGNSVPFHEVLSVDDYLARTRGIPRSQEDLRDLCLDVRALVSSLQPRDRVVCLLLIDQDVTNVASSVGIPRRSLRDVISRLRQDAEERGLKEYFGIDRRLSRRSGN
ncbi:MAG: sigma-70 family RNA polymerase sigma factor [Krumholzibacteria bacterium]|nr:sigma-70 family RNA polymerase sigma factor [Candidatus Krumholzibacteria bacterium]